MPITRENCWMTFSEALEQYLTARENLARAAYKHNSPDIEEAAREMRLAAEHMDVLTNEHEEL